LPKEKVQVINPFEGGVMSQEEGNESLLVNKKHYEAKERGGDTPSTTAPHKD